MTKHQCLDWWNFWNIKKVEIDKHSLYWNIFFVGVWDHQNKFGNNKVIKS